MGRVKPGRLLLAAACALALALPAAAQVTRIDVERREPFAGGEGFGDAGPYEKLSGSLWLEVDPRDPANARIADLDLAPRNARGRVEVRTDFYLLKPVDARRGSGRLLYDVANRGNKIALASFNGAGGNDPDAAGDGFLMRRGWSMLWTGWSGDVLPGGGRMTLDVPVAERDGRPVEGLVYAELEAGLVQLYEVNVLRSRERADQVVPSLPIDWGGTRSYPALRQDDAVLSVRPRRDSPATEIPRSRWRFARAEDGRVVPDPTHVWLEDGFRPGLLYDLVYTARGPRISGLGFAAVRDAIAFFRHAAADAAGTANPLAGAVDFVYGYGGSQSGRFLHHFVYEGFNADLDGRAVFDAVMPHVAGAGRGLFNHRFGQSTRHGSQHEENLFASDVFPFTSTPGVDPVTGERGDMLARARAAGPVPRIFFTQTSTEYWSRAASLLHTDAAGERDAPLDPAVRIYLIAGTAHNAMTGGVYDNPVNRSSTMPAMRALLIALDAWASEGAEPPASRYPRIADGTLVDLETFRGQFPDIPGVREPTVLYRPLRLDPGPRWEADGVADHVPPRAGPPYRTLVPAVDEDGNEIAGIRLPHVAVPLATHTGWNLRAAAWGADGMLTRWMGSTLPFPATAEERRAGGDPRRAVTQRYASEAARVAAVEAVVRRLEEEGFVLPEDGERLRREAAEVRLPPHR